MLIKRELLMLLIYFESFMRRSTFNSDCSTFIGGLLLIEITSSNPDR